MGNNLTTNICSIQIQASEMVCILCCWEVHTELFILNEMELNGVFISYFDFSVQVKVILNTWTYIQFPLFVTYFNIKKIGSYPMTFFIEYWYCLVLKKMILVTFRIYSNIVFSTSLIGWLESINVFVFLKTIRRLVS